MRLSRIVFSFVLLILLTPFCMGVSKAELHSTELDLLTLMNVDTSLLFVYHINDKDTPSKASSSQTPNGGIKENIPDKYQSKYQAWKREFLSTELGRTQWEKYAQRTDFTVTITISKDNSRGASTGEYKWDSSGKLIAATITFGHRLNEGYPNPIYYPVMNSLMLPETSYRIDGDVLAATKFAHEFGHLVYADATDSKVFRTQTELMPIYNKIFLSNGRKISDPRLIDLANKMGGRTPIEIWEDREYWGEVNAMLFIRDKFPENDLRCEIFNKIKKSLDMYAKNYSERFHVIAQSASSHKRCGWQ